MDKAKKAIKDSCWKCNFYHATLLTKTHAERIARIAFIEGQITILSNHMESSDRQKFMKELRLELKKLIADN